MAIALREVGEDRNRLAAALSAEAGDTRITGLTADEADRVKRTKWLHGNCKCVETQALLAIIDRLTESPQ
jgi:hypothetical protein